MDKKTVIDAFERQIRESLEKISQRELELTSSAQADEEYGADRLGSKQEEFMDEANTNNSLASALEDSLLALNNIENKGYTAVESGALVETDATSFLICTALREVNVDGKSVVGISIQAPIFQAIDGKKAGDSIDFNGTKFIIKKIS